MPEIKAFRDWKFEEVERTFGLTQIYDSPFLGDWLSEATHYPVDAPTESVLKELQKELQRNINLYNEEEYKVYFMGPLLRLIAFQTDSRRPFMDRPLSFEYQEGKMAGGRVDWMLAEGRQDPRQPYFFLHEYKREVDAKGDPIGQLLIAMVGARELNEIKFPMIGCYVLGRNWFFLVLEAEHYAVSDAFVSTQSDLIDIYRILQVARQKIETLA